MKQMTRSLPRWLPILHLLTIMRPALAGLDAPVDPSRLLQKLYGAPCECRGGHQRARPERFSQSVDCGTRTAYLAMLTSTRGGFTQSWQCVDKPRLTKQGDPCPTNCVIVDQMNAMCYTSYSECTLGGARYFTAKPHMSYEGTFGGDWSVVPSSRGNPKYAAASCTAPVGRDACWPMRAPLHVSDGGPTDMVREVAVGQQI
ncbi:uncharacterized protein LOC101558661 [Sorex araneus]|uniref:uncharacterized protein LOC101558661 n=1 Tax=Sorex araneus TaxID=42254 RepID=UPI002433EB21|nr:uncharacterized protein LOC101558661 [Sorex araneus]